MALTQSHNNALKHTHEPLHTFHSCLTPPPCCPQGPILIPGCCTDLPCSLFNTSFTLQKSLRLFDSLSPLPFFFSSHSFYNFLLPLLLCSLTPSLPLHPPPIPTRNQPPFPSPYQAAELPSLSVWEFNHSIKSQISTLKILNIQHWVSDDICSAPIPTRSLLSWSANTPTPTPSQLQYMSSWYLLF